MYDSRIARRWNIDPVEKPFESLYSVLGGNPIYNVDPNGDDWFKNDITGEVKYFERAGAWTKKKGWTRLGQHHVWFTDIYYDLIDVHALYEDADLFVFGHKIWDEDWLYGNETGQERMTFKQGVKVMLGTATIVFTLGTAGPVVAGIFTGATVTTSTVVTTVTATVSLANGVFSVTADEKGMTFMDKQSKSIQMTWNTISLASSVFSIGMSLDKFSTAMAKSPGFNKESAKMLWNYFNFSNDLASSLKSLNSMVEDGDSQNTGENTGGDTGSDSKKSSVSTGKTTGGT